MMIGESVFTKKLGYFLQEKIEIELESTCLIGKQAKEIDNRYFIKAPSPQPSTSVTDTSNLIADELRKLANLRDAGILTDEELTQQKMKLLTRE